MGLSLSACVAAFAAAADGGIGGGVGGSSSRAAGAPACRQVASEAGERPAAVRAALNPASVAHVVPIRRRRARAVDVDLADVFDRVGAALKRRPAAGAADGRAERAEPVGVDAHGAEQAARGGLRDFVLEHLAFLPNSCFLNAP